MESETKILIVRAEWASILTLTSWAIWGLGFRSSLHSVYRHFDPNAEALQIIILMWLFWFGILTLVRIWDLIRAD